MRSVIAAIAFFALVTNPSSVRAWGMDGHHTVGAITDSLLQGTPAEKKVKSLLVDGNLEKYATWMDCAKGYCGPLTDDMRRFVMENKDHHTYHYTDIPIQETEYSLKSHGANPNDVVQILQQCIAVLSGKATDQTNPHKFTERQALMIITHLIGDIHQPLHVGATFVGTNSKFVNPNVHGKKYEETQGGNFILISASTSLHSYWDGTLVQDIKKNKTVAEFATAIQPLSEPWKNDGDIGTWPKIWADESLKLATKVQLPLRLGVRQMSVPKRPGEKPHPLWHVTFQPASYRTDADLIARQQMSKAGHRLAALLQAIWP